MMGPCPTETGAVPGSPGAAKNSATMERSITVRTAKTVASYARYALTSLANVAFIISGN